MSRTYKDRPYKKTEEYKEHDRKYDYTNYVSSRHEYDYRLGKVVVLECERTYSTEKPGFKTKKKRNHTEYNWYSNPMWWNHLHSIVPQRRRSENWCKELAKGDVDYEFLEDADPPMISNKPHMYYW